MVMKMISTLVFIVSFTAIQCQPLPDDCKFLIPYNQSNGIQVFHSVHKKENWMYHNGYEIQFTITTTNVVKLKPKTYNTTDSQIINRFSGHDYDCDVKYQNGKNGLIVTKCSNDNREDTTYQFDAKAIIFRASKNRTNDWVIIWSKNKSYPNISCYSPKDNPRLLQNESQCLIRAQIESQLLDFIKTRLKDSIEGIIDYGPKGTIDGHYIFFNIDGIPYYCDELKDTETKCESVNDLTRVSEACFPPPAVPSKGNAALWISLIVLAIICLILSLIGVYYGLLREQKRLQKRLDKYRDTNLLIRYHYITYDITAEISANERDSEEVRGHCDEDRHTEEQLDVNYNVLGQLEYRRRVLDDEQTDWDNKRKQLRQKFTSKHEDVTAILANHATDTNPPNPANKHADRKPGLREAPKHVPWKCPSCQPNQQPDDSNPPNAGENASTASSAQRSKQPKEFWFKRWSNGNEPNDPQSIHYIPPDDENFGFPSNTDQISIKSKRGADTQTGIAPKMSSHTTDPETNNAAATPPKEGSDKKQTPQSSPNVSAGKTGHRAKPSGAAPVETPPAAQLQQKQTTDQTTPKQSLPKPKDTSSQKPSTKGQDSSRSESASPGAAISPNAGQTTAKQPLTQTRAPGGRKPVTKDLKSPSNQARLKSKEEPEKKPRWK